MIGCENWKSIKQKQKTQYGHIMETLVSIKSDVAELKSKPGKRWESIVGALISAFVGGLIAFGLMQIGLG